MFLYDTHVHTSEVSPCSYTPAAEAIGYYLDAGYDGLVITDHYTYGVCDPEIESGLTQDAAVERFLSGYEAAIRTAAGKMTILLGMELRFYEMNNDFLVFGISHDFLLKYPDIRHMRPSTFHQLAKENDLLVFAAHPFRNGMMVLPPSVIDGVEVMNGHLGHDSRNYLAEAYADQFNLLKSSGSDFHEAGNEARGGIITKTSIRDNKDLLECLRNQPALMIPGSNW